MVSPAPPRTLRPHRGERRGAAGSARHAGPAPGRRRPAGPGGGHGRARGAAAIGGARPRRGSGLKKARSEEKASGARARRAFSPGRLLFGRNNTTASKFFRRLLQPPQLGSAVDRSHLSDGPPAAPLRLGGSVRPRKPRPRLPAPQPDPPEPPGPAEQPAGADEAERQRANPPRAEGAGVEGGQRLRSGQSPARRGACAHPPAVCGVFRGIRFKRIWERRWRVRKAPLSRSPSPPSRISTRPLNALPLADSCGIQPVLVWKRLRPALRAYRSAAAEDGAQLGPQRTAAGWERGSASKMLLRTDTAREAQIQSPTPGKHGSPLPSPTSVLTPGDFRKGESGAVPLPSAAGAVAKDKRAAENHSGGG